VAVNFYVVRPEALPPRGTNVGDIFYVNGGGRELYQVQADYSLKDVALIVPPAGTACGFPTTAETSITDGDVLIFNAATQQWAPAAPASPGPTLAQVIALSIALS